MTTTENSKKPIPALEETRKFPYVTADLCVVTYLRAQGCKVDSVGRGEGEDRTVFCFMVDSPEEVQDIKKHVRDYHNNKGGFRLFADLWRDTKGMTKTMR